MTRTRPSSLPRRYHVAGFDLGGFAKSIGDATGVTQAVADIPGKLGVDDLAGKLGKTKDAITSAATTVATDYTAVKKTASDTSTFVYVALAVGGVAAAYFAMR